MQPPATIKMDIYQVVSADSYTCSPKLSGLLLKAKFIRPTIQIFRQKSFPALHLISLPVHLNGLIVTIPAANFMQNYNKLWQDYLLACL